VPLARMKALIQTFRQRGVRITYTHIFVRAAALALAANPDLHTMICGPRVHRLTRVDIALSIDAESALAPVLVIEGAESKSLCAISAEIAKRVPQVPEEHRKMISLLKRWGWLVPLSFLRQSLLRLLYRSVRFRRKGSGTFQVSIVFGVDSFSTPLFNASGILTAGRVRERVIPVEGSAVISPTVILTCSADHRLWSGKDGQRFLLSVQNFLESEQRETELLGEPLWATIVSAGASL
jgi:pyruvate/2-oxoglutarate dehydrogenase complex dihydrolipoamide acyltransferase (E2) component